MKLYRNTKVVHVPISVTGFVIDALALIFLATVIIAIDRNSHSVSDMFYNLFPYLVTTFLFREWLAAKLS